MPNIITRRLGLEFGEEELIDLYPELEDCELRGQEFFDTACSLLEKSHEQNEFEEFGFTEDCMVNEISMDGDTVFMEFF